MELRHVRYFLAIVDFGSVSAAAQELHIAQPSVSRQVRQLEADLGLTLFDRAHARLALTAAGRQFVALARDLIDRADSAVASAASMAAGQLTRIAIAAPSTSITDVVAPFLATFAETDPFPELWDSAPDAVFDRLESGADLAVGTHPAPPAYQTRLLATLPVWLYVSPEHRWARRSSVRLAAIAGETVLVLPPAYKPRRVFDEAIEAAGVRLSSVVEAGSPAVAQALAAASRGVAIVSDDSRFGLKGLKIIGAQGPLTVNLYAAWRSDHHARPAIAGLADRLAVFCAERYGSSVGRPRPRRARS